MGRRWEGECCFSIRAVDLVGGLEITLRAGIVGAPITTNAIPGKDRNAMSSEPHPAKSTLASPLMAFCTAAH
jgi:hypothetical protein